MTVIPSHFFSIFFIIGIITVVTYAWKQFNQPSFPNQDTLPRAVVPLRYLFLRSAYGKARFAYVTISLLLYCVLVWPGPVIIPIFGKLSGVEFPADTWALVVALLLVGIIPNSNQKWLIAVEGALRRSVHAWFLVPDGVVKTIGVLEDTIYDPPAAQLDAAPNPLQTRLRNDLRLSPITLRYRWARAGMLMASLQQMGPGDGHPLKQAAFDPFQQDFDQIRARYRTLEQEIEQFERSPPDAGREDNLIRSVEGFLKQVYAYISWGIRYQAVDEKQVDQILADLGFRIPPTGGQRLFDIVAPTALLVAGMTSVFWVIYYGARQMMGAVGPTSLGMSEIINPALSSGIAAALMYGSAVFIALRQRGNQIDRRVWREGSAACFAPIAIWAGVVAWGIIAFTTMLGQLPIVGESLIALTHAIKSAAGVEQEKLSPDWNVFPFMVLSALPWFLAGATVSVLLARVVGTHILRSSVPDRIRDVIGLGIGLGAAAATAQLVQGTLVESLLHQQFSYFVVLIVGLVGMACGGVIGFMVPEACRVNLRTPPDRIMARALQELLTQATDALATKVVAESWVFEARPELGGITPAEAVQYKGLATSVRRLVDNISSATRNDLRSSENDRPVPLVIKGGRAGARRASHET